MLFILHRKKELLLRKQQYLLTPLVYSTDVLHHTHFNVHEITYLLILLTYSKYLHDTLYCHVYMSLFIILGSCGGVVKGFVP